MEEVMTDTPMSKSDGYCPNCGYCLLDSEDALKQFEALLAVAEAADLEELARFKLQYDAAADFRREKQKRLARWRKIRDGDEK
jgi:hypothetical protein